MAIEKKESNIKKAIGESGLKTGGGGLGRNKDSNIGRADVKRGLDSGGLDTGNTHSKKTEDEKKNSTTEDVKKSFPDAEIRFGRQEEDRPHRFSNAEPPITIQAGQGVNIAKTGNDYMISVDFEKTFASYPVKAAIASNNPPPFDVTLTTGESDELLLAIGEGYYQVGATGVWEHVTEIIPTEGNYAYFVINQDATLAVTSVELIVDASELDAVEVIGSAPVTGYTSRVLLAYIDTDVLIKVRYGNFVLEHKQIDGDVVLWPDTVGGAI